MSLPIALISTDFDGTLISQPSDGRCVPDLARALAQFKSRGGIWAINTGRSLTHTLEGLELFAAPVQPDFLLTLERDIHLPDGRGGWQPLEPWHTLCRDRHAELFDSSGGIFDHILEGVRDSPDVTVIRENDQPVGLITTDEAAMDIVASVLETVQRAFPDFSYQRNSIYLRFCHVDYHKGAALAELTRHLNLTASEVFAAGDHYNDISMLSPTCSGSVACPANAIFAVKNLVQQQGGFVSDQEGGYGTSEALFDRVV